MEEIGRSPEGWRQDLEDGLRRDLQAGWIERDSAKGMKKQGKLKSACLNRFKMISHTGGG